MIPPTLIALAEFGPGRALIVIIGAIIINLAIENIVEPALTGKQLKLSATAVFVSFFFWGWLLGPVGVFLSMPITVLIMLVLDQLGRDTLGSEVNRNIAGVIVLGHQLNY